MGGGGSERAGGKAITSVMLGVVAACADPAEPQLRKSYPVVRHVSAFSAGTADTAAQRQLQLAAAGRRSRGDEDEMLRVEAQVPGFGGFFLDSTGQMILYTKDTSQSSAAALRREISAVYRTRASAGGGTLGLSAASAAVRIAQYTLSELVGYGARLSARLLPIEGLQAFGVRMNTNRLSMVFMESGQFERAQAALTGLGVPREAVDPIVTPPFVTTASWHDKFRPTRGGVKIAWQGSGTCSYGFNVHRALPIPYQTSFMLTAAHCVMGTEGSTGTIGDTLFQATTSNGAVARVQVNPVWPSTGCPVALDGLPAEYCPEADVLLAHPTAGVVFDRRVGTSDHEGHSGNSGSASISGWRNIAGIITPAAVFYGRNVVHKSGWITGTTTGEMVLARSQVEVKIPSLGPTVSMIVPCAAVVEAIGGGLGDSGAPVFARATDGGPYMALGVQFAATVVPGQSRCQAGTACLIIFSPWDRIEAHLGIGSLDPRTVIP